jgi:hypothetical protein
MCRKISDGPRIAIARDWRTVHVCPVKLALPCFLRWRITANLNCEGAQNALRDSIHQLLESPALISLAIALFLTNCITTFDTRIIQAKRGGTLPPDQANLPAWVSVLYILDWFFLGALLLLNWRVGLAVWALLFVLKVLPVLETIGNLMMSPFKNRG